MEISLSNGSGMVGCSGGYLGPSNVKVPLSGHIWKGSKGT